jgi:hypothetical protein
MFKHGKKKYPMWFGGGYRAGEIPAEYIAGKAGTEPKTWLWKTPMGYSLIFNELTQSVKVQTPTGYSMALDEALQTAELKTPIGFSVLLNEVLKLSQLKTPTGYTLNLDETQQKAEMVTPSMQALALNEAAGEASVTGTTKAVLTAALVELGLGASQSVIIAELFASFYDAHTHPSPAGGATGAPVIPMTPAISALSSATVKIRP